MRHRKAGRRLGRNSSHRKAMLRNMVTSLLEHGEIRTTDTRAKEVRRLAERLITMGKKALRSSNPEGISDQDYAAKKVHLYRQVLRVIFKKNVAKMVMDEYAERFEEREGGYTRIIKLGRRRGDNSPLSILQLVDSPIVADDTDLEDDDSTVEAQEE